MNIKQKVSTSVTSTSRPWAALSVFVTATVLSFVVASAQQPPNKPSTQHPSPPAKPAQNSHQENAGELVFATNCSRCHNAPDGFSQNISGTVVRHMRVRASLSEQDEKALLRFLNP